MCIRALIKEKGKPDIAIHCQGYPVCIVPLILQGVNLLTLLKAEIRTDKKGFTAMLSQFDYVYYKYRRLTLREGKPHYKKELRVYQQATNNGRFRLFQNFII